MSISIGGGIKIKPGIELSKIKSILNTIGPQIIVPSILDRIKEGVINEAIGDMAEYLYDEYYMTKQIPVLLHRFVVDRLDLMYNEKKRALYKPFKAVDEIDAGITVFPIKDGILAIPHAGHRETLNQLLSNIPHTEYAYWNNADKPGELTEFEWNKRYEDWMEAMPSLVPASDGFYMQLMDPVQLFNIRTMDLLEECVEKVEGDILATVAKHIFESRIVSEDDFRGVEGIPKLPINPTNSDLLKFGREVINFSHSDSGKKLYAEEAIPRAEKILSSMRDRLSQEIAKKKSNELSMI